MDSTGGAAGYGSLDHIYIFGPICFDGYSLTARIVPDIELKLAPDEFNVLYLLAAREDSSFKFDAIYASVWDRGDGVDRRSVAKKRMKAIAKKINSAGGFAWIEFNRKSGYTLRTKWAHNRESWQCGSKATAH